MKDKILDLIATKPKHYSVIVSRNPAMLEWIQQNTLTDTNHLPTKIYSAIHQISTRCPNGNNKKITRWNDGLVGCGPASVCECTKNKISSNVSKTKSSMTATESHEINRKRSQTMLEKYGVEYNSQRPEIKDVWTKPKISEEVHQKLSNKSWLECEYVTKARTSVDIAAELGVYYSTVISYCITHGFAIRKRSNYSLVEIEIARYIESMGFETIKGDWDTLGDKEIDILIPSKNIGIEVNGLYWHSHGNGDAHLENKDKHLSKTIAAYSKGIQLIHITDWEWNNKQDIIKSLLKSKLGITDKRIYARQCELVTLSGNESKAFLETNHLQGYIPSSIKYGLKFNGELLMIATAGRSRFEKNSDCLELHRLASAHNITVVGGASKLISAIMAHTTKLITYCDKSKSIGNAYSKIGFTYVRDTAPGYFWTDGTEVISRHKCQKQNLAKWLKPFDPSKSETENMFASKYRRYWDCGNYVFELVR